MLKDATSNARRWGKHAQQYTTGNYQVANVALIPAKGMGINVSNDVGQISSEQIMQSSWDCVLI